MFYLLLEYVWSYDDSDDDITRCHLTAKETDAELWEAECPDGHKREIVEVGEDFFLSSNVEMGSFPGWSISMEY